MVVEYRQFGSVRPRDVVAYLAAHQWSVVEEQPAWTRGNTQVWVNPSTEGELLVPLQPTFDDYGLLVANLCSSLAAQEATDATSVLRSIAAVGFDTIRLRVRSSAEVDTLDFGDAVTLLRASRNLISAAAASVVEPRPTHPSRRPSAVNAYLGRLRMAQTEHGSFVVAIRSPVDAQPAVPSEQLQLAVDPPDRDHEVVSERRAPDGGPGRTMTLGLFAAVEAARGAVPVLQRRDYARFDEVVHLGVSSNLYGALADLARLGDATLEFSVTWSPLVPLPPDDEERLSAVVEVPGDLRSWFAQGDQRLRSLPTLEPIQVSGPVTDLHREPAGLLGEALIRTAMAGTAQTVRLLLSPDGYDLALLAHDRRQPLACSGIARRQGRFLVIEMPADLRIVGDEP